MSSDDTARTPDDDLDRLMRGAVPGQFSFFGREKEKPSPPRKGAKAGQVIGDYRLVALIGQGGMGQVWEAEELSLKRRVALKLVRPDRVNEHTLDLFSREARAGGRLSHPGIVGVHGHGEADGVAWISMDFVEGAWTLKDFIEETARGGELPDDYYGAVAKLMAELADALQAAHEANVIHRDLKPANVLITPDEHPKVTDFGLAKITDETALSVTGDLAGTYAYMSPEQVAAKRIGLDHRTDIFSLGVVLYELLVLQRPFTGDTSQQVGRQIMLEEPMDPRKLRSKVPWDLAVIGGKCLEKHPDRRYKSMAEVSADIRRHLADEPILAKPPTAWQRGVKWVRRHPTLSGIVTVGTAALVAISILLAENVRTNKDLRAAGKTITTERNNLANANERLEAQQVYLETAKFELEQFVSLMAAEPDPALIRHLVNYHALRTITEQAGQLHPLVSFTRASIEELKRFPYESASPEILELWHPGEAPGSALVFRASAPPEQESSDLAASVARIQVTNTHDEGVYITAFSVMDGGATLITTAESPFVFPGETCSILVGLTVPRYKASVARPILDRYLVFATTVPVFGQPVPSAPEHPTKVRNPGSGTPYWNNYHAANRLWSIAAQGTELFLPEPFGIVAVDVLVSPD